jgi:hypothetical protein
MLAKKLLEGTLERGAKVMISVDNSNNIITQ